MELKHYLRALPNDEARDNFARRCGTTRKYLRVVSYSQPKLARLCPEICINIERESGGVVRVEELRPDIAWWVIRAPGALQIANSRARRQPRRRPAKRENPAA